ncbi:hypothetical protein BVC71_01095 [Marivivens niveibacter]|uniref:HMA domain-containing protein n=1 Tax=Marivivens niveibacter TaxID=1930667 RepID=A0A251X1F2_9RHOB|nr:heavy-metal-associated domain-containing protein [Marivivens niveibacter]OUD10144.1 hypothetical protein BVC71_01095 [Marivivens niveibacter]
MKLSVPEMSCGHCKTSISNAIEALDSTAKVDFDMDAKQISIHTDKPLNTIQDALNAIGFDNAVV